MTDEPEIAASWVAIDALAPWADNPRINDAAVDKVAASIKRFGFGAPIVAREADGMVIAGHTRLKAARALGLDRVPVRYLDLDPADAKLLAIADNRVGEEASWDDDVLGAVLRTFDLDLDLGPLGFDDDELAALLSDPLAPGPPADDDAPEVQEGPPDSVLGGVYELGPHRLVCGDCTDAEIVTALFGEGACDIILTDPPYCSGGFQEAGRAQGSTTAVAKKATIARDNLTTAGLEVLIERAIGRLPAVGCCYVFSDWRQFSTIRRAVEPLGFQYRAMLVWDKQTPGMGGPWRHQFELVYFGTRRKEPPIGRSGDVIRCARSGNHLHTTEKPVELMAKILDNTEGKVVCDPFAGSGTTLMACAQESRVARCIEIDPRYCDVIRRRWTRYATEHGLDPGPGALA